MTDCICIKEFKDQNKFPFKLDQRYNFRIYGPYILVGELEAITESKMNLTSFKNHFSYLKDSKDCIVI